MTADFLISAEDKRNLFNITVSEHGHRVMMFFNDCCTLKEAFELFALMNVPIIPDGTAYHFAVYLYLKYKERSYACHAACEAFSETTELPVEILHKICTQYVHPSRYADCWEMQKPIKRACL